MDTKYKKLEKKEAEYQPEYLLSFMILRKGFSQEYIKNTIKECLTPIKISDYEFELLEYISFKSSNHETTSRRDPNVFIPLECCDYLMGATIRKSAFWEKTMSSTLKMFLIIEQKDASGMQIRMAHPALA